MDICISEFEVVKIIAAAEITLNKCFEMLLDFKTNKGSISVALFDFQPMLSQCLYNLMRFYQKLNKYKKTLINEKNKFKESDFSSLMKLNSKHLHAVRSCIEIGKNIGDAFVWFFFRNNREELEKHLNHEPTGLFVSGIGGQGEIEFVKNNQTINGFYVIYHSITNVLRIGDFSLYDIDKGIVGVGEIKSKPINDKLKVTATFVLKDTIQCQKIAYTPQENKIENRISELKCDFPRIERQIKAQIGLIQSKETDELMKMQVINDISILNALQPTVPVVLNSDNSMAVIGVWTFNKSLSEVLLNDEYCESLPNKEIQKYISFLNKPESLYNAFFVGELDTKLNQLNSPVVWWRINDTICKDIYFKRIKILNIFNPATLIQYFINDGFSITNASSLDKYIIEKMIDNHKIQIGRFDSLCYLIMNDFMRTKDVYNTYKKSLDSIKIDQIKCNTKVEMQIRVDNFGIR